jgi:hypothetical protein
MDGRMETQLDNDSRDKVQFLYKYFKFSVKTQSKRIKEEQRELDHGMSRQE